MSRDALHNARADRRWGQSTHRCPRQRSSPCQVLAEVAARGFPSWKRIAAAIVTTPASTAKSQISGRANFRPGAVGLDVAGGPTNERLGSVNKYAGSATPKWTAA